MTEYNVHVPTPFSTLVENRYCIEYLEAFLQIDDEGNFIKAYGYTDDWLRSTEKPSENSAFVLLRKRPTNCHFSDEDYENFYNGTDTALIKACKKYPKLMINQINN